MSQSGEGTAPPPRKRGPVPRLSADMISDAVLDLGFDRASLNAVASTLGVQHGALYRYIGDRDGMMRTAANLAITRYPWPDASGAWRQVLRAEAVAWWEFCTMYPGFVEVLAEVGTVPPALAKRSLTVATHLWRSGVDAVDAVLVVDLVVGTIHSMVHWAASRSSAIEEVVGLTADGIAEYSAGVPDEVLAVAVGELVEDAWPWFDRKLELILDGVAARMGEPGLSEGSEPL